jgi:hypothetical protein
LSNRASENDSVICSGRYILLLINKINKIITDRVSSNSMINVLTYTAQFSKKSLGSDIGEIKKMSEKLKKMSVLTSRNVREKSNTVMASENGTQLVRSGK